MSTTYQVIHDIFITKKTREECYDIAQWLIENDIKIQKLEINSDYSDSKLFNFRVHILDDDQYISFKLRWQ